MVAPFLPALLGLGTSVAGTIINQQERRGALSDLKRRAAGQGLASRHQLNRAASQATGMAQAGNPQNANLARRNALLANAEMQAAGAGAVAAEQNAAQSQLLGARQQNADMLMRSLLGVGAGLAGGAESLIASQATDVAKKGLGLAAPQGGDFPGQSAGALSAPLSPMASLEKGIPLMGGGTAQPSVPVVQEQRQALTPGVGPAAVQAPVEVAPIDPGQIGGDFAQPGQFQMRGQQPVPSAPLMSPNPATQVDPIDPNQIGMGQPASPFAPEGAPLQERPIEPLSSIFPLWGLGFRSYA